jgi:hypothetical protein
VHTARAASKENRYAAGMPADRRKLAEEAHAGWPRHGGTRRSIRARAVLARQLWARNGERRLPSLRALDAAISALHRGDLEWVCEFNPLSPLYLLPTSRWIRALVDELRRLGALRVLEVGAGDGFLTQSLRKAAPEIEFFASDSGAWEDPAARMSADEKKALRNTTVAGVRLGQHVLRMEARAAIRRFKPDLVLVSWPPPGPMLDSLIRAKVQYVLDVGAAGGVTASAWSWRYAHEFCDGPLEVLGRCRLDERPARSLSTRVTLYFGAAHPDHACERVKPGDWLWQFRPTKDEASPVD